MEAASSWNWRRICQHWASPMPEAPAAPPNKAWNISFQNILEPQSPGIAAISLNFVDFVKVKKSHTYVKCLDAAELVTIGGHRPWTTVCAGAHSHLHHDHPSFLLPDSNLFYCALFVPETYPYMVYLSGTINNDVIESSQMASDGVNLALLCQLSQATAR
ncbi:hypothetical protein EK904_009776 [Melospiza melodia maxima]|nr:hypothetical protein EK904_009776 [Melospiza melodia maxima]